METVDTSASLKSVRWQQWADAQAKFEASGLTVREFCRQHNLGPVCQHKPERWSGETRNWKPVMVVHLNPERPLHTEINQPLETDPLIKKAA